MDEQIPVAFDGTAVAAVEVDGVGVEGQGGEAEQEGWGRREVYGVGGRVESCGGRRGC